MRKFFILIGLIALLFMVQACDKQTSITNLTDLLDRSLTVHFDSKGGSEINTISIDLDNSDFELEEPIREGYTFLGWFYNLDDEKVVNDFKDITENSIILYAKWEVNVYTLTFNVGDEEYEYNLNFGEDISLLDQDFKEKEGHSFNGWFIDEDLSSAYNLENMPAENLVLYGDWEKNSYKLKFIEIQDHFPSQRLLIFL